MASCPGELQLRTVPDPYANARLVSALSMGDAGILSGIPRTLYRAKRVEFPLFRDSRPPLVHEALRCAFHSKYTTHDLIMSSSSPVSVTGMQPQSAPGREDGSQVTGWPRLIHCDAWSRWATVNEKSDGNCSAVRVVNIDALVRWPKARIADNYVAGDMIPG